MKLSKCLDINKFAINFGNIFSIDKPVRWLPGQTGRKNAGIALVLASIFNAVKGKKSPKFCKAIYAQALKYPFSLLAVLVFLTTCSKDVTSRAEQLQANVVAIKSNGLDDTQHGFGFITGQQENNLYIVTANHVIQETKDVEVVFQMDQANPRRAEAIFTDPNYDVALLKVEDPPIFSWYQHCLGSGKEGNDIGFIGRHGDWHITSGREIGSISGFGINTINCYLPTVSVGTSGAPVIHDSGIIGMILSDYDTATEALDVNIISQLLKKQSAAYFQLKATGFSLGEIVTKPGSVQLEKDLAAFAEAQSQDQIPGYLDYLDQYPNGKFVPQAKKRIKELKALEAIKKEDDLWAHTRENPSKEKYLAYLEKYPKGRYVLEAQDKLESLDGDKEKKAFTQDTEDINDSKSNTDISTVVDRDGNTYTTKVMKDGKRWMTQNLNVEVADSWCYDNDPKNCEQYGRLYTWQAAKNACHFLGKSWKLPSDEEWTNMVDNYGGAKYGNSKDGGASAYKALMDQGSSGLTALLGGYRIPVGSSSPWAATATTGAVRSAMLTTLGATASTVVVSVSTATTAISLWGSRVAVWRIDYLVILIFDWVFIIMDNKVQKK